jgi:hypothetical protein
MNKDLLLVLALPLLMILILPATSHADAALVQDSCEVFDMGGITHVRIYFTVVNFSLPTDVCDLHLIPEPQPVPPECAVLQCGAPVGWSCFLNPFGGADWFANTPNDCIAPGTGKGEFSIVLDPGFCCYIAQFTDATGQILLEQEECFTLCGKVADEEGTWGGIKSRYSK